MIFAKYRVDKNYATALVKYFWGLFDFIQKRLAIRTVKRVANNMYFEEFISKSYLASPERKILR